MAKQVWTAHYKGQTFTRSASQRAYSHVIVNEFANGRIEPAAWAGSLAIAIARCGQESRHQTALNRARDSALKVIRTDMIFCQLEDAPAKVAR